MLSPNRVSLRNGDKATLLSGFFAIDNNLLIPVTDSLEYSQRDSNMFRGNVFVTNPLQNFNGYGLFSPFISNMFKENVPFDKIDLKDLQNYVEVCKNIMGFDMFSEWVYLQRNAIYLSETGLAFLKDCIDFLETGIRSYNPYTMLTLIQASSGSKNFTKEIDELYQRTKKIEQDIGAENLSELFTYWMMLNNGVDDFKASMFIFFGNVRELEVV
jgi:hypothetical protein